MCDVRKREAKLPTSFRNDINKPDEKECLAAMKLEMESLEEMTTWKLVEVPIEGEAIKSEWVHSLKRDVDEIVIRRNVDLMAKG